MAPRPASLDLVCCTLVGEALAVLVRARGAATECPWIPFDAATPLDAAATRFARTALGRAPAWMTQVGATADGRAHPSGAPLTVSYVAVVPAGTAAPAGMRWAPATALPALPARQKALVAGALAALRDRMDLAPIAFRLLPPVFTLGELQATYELLLGRPLHKASFRRALQGAFLVEPTDAWRSEGRGRPAQLFRYAPRTRRGRGRSVRFELLG
jgi:8-oxo-dGTP diphosphatase